MKLTNGTACRPDGLIDRVAHVWRLVAGIVIFPYFIFGATLASCSRPNPVVGDWTLTTIFEHGESRLTDSEDWIMYLSFDPQSQFVMEEVENGESQHRIRGTFLLTDGTLVLTGQDDFARGSQIDVTAWKYAFEYEKRGEEEFINLVWDSPERDDLHGVKWVFRRRLTE